MHAEDVKMTVTKMSAPVALSLDDDGTPVYKGERLVEVRPGEWTTPDAAALEEFLRKALPRLG